MIKLKCPKFLDMDGMQFMDERTVTESWITSTDTCKTVGLLAEIGAYFPSKWKQSLSPKC